MAASGRTAMDLPPEPPAEAAMPEPEDLDPSAWAVRSIQMAQAPIHVPRPAPSSPTAANALNGVVFSLGQSIALGRPYVSGQTNVDNRSSCIEKQQGQVIFCVEPVDWPEQMRPYLLTSSVLYQGLNTVVRYDHGRATRYHAVFPSESFDLMAGYFTQLYGPPTDTWNRTVAPLALPRQANPTASWRSIDAVTRTASILEVRMFDDSRGGFPDTKRGAIMLYSAQTDHIFPQVSALELMRLRSR